MESNPDAIEDRKEVVYRDPAGGTVITRQAIGEGGVVATTERDVEQGQQFQEPPADTTTNVVVMGTARQTVKPSPTHAAAPSKSERQQQPQRSGGGFMGAFATRSRGRFFFSLHAGIALFSFLVFVSSALFENRLATPGRFVQYEMLVAQISFAISLGACVLERLGFLENIHLRLAISGFQIFFWAPALVIMTFYGTFLSPIVNANGFFGAWGALLAAAIVFANEHERTRRDPRNSSAPRTSLLLLFLTSLMIMGSGIRLYQNSNNGSGITNQQPGQAPGDGVPGNGQDFSGAGLPGTPAAGTPVGANDFARWSYVVLAISFGAITAFLSILFLLFLDSTPAKTMLGLGTLLWVWVAVVILILTFADPFELAYGNGYYSCLFALLSSFGLIVSLRIADRQSSNTDRDSDRETAQSANFFLFMRGVAFSSLVVMIAAALVCRDGCGSGIIRYQVAAGAVSLGLTLLVVLLEGFGLYRVTSWLKMGFALFILLWWVAAFIVLTWYGTFQSPVFTTGNYANGFFFTWAATIFAGLAFAESLKDHSRSADDRSTLTAQTGFLLVVIVGSLIELGSAIKWYYNVGSTNLSRYALAVGPVSIGLVLILFFVLLCTRKNYEAQDSTYNAGLYLLTIWWAIALLVLTYMGFWSSALDNGYFALFFTFGACLLAVSGIWRTEDDDDDSARHQTGNRESGAPYQARDAGYQQQQGTYQQQGAYQQPGGASNTTGRYY